MRKEDLVVGKHIVQLKNGKIGVLMYDSRGDITVINNRMNLTGVSFEDDTLGYNIVKVGVPTFSSVVGIFQQPNWLWELGVAKEMTIEEISNELGYEVKIVK